MDSKSNQIFCQDIFQIFYKYDPLQFLLHLEQISFKYFWYLLQQIQFYELVSETEFGNNISKRIWEMENL